MEKDRRNKKQGNSKFLKGILLVNLVLAVVLVSSITYSYYVTKETIPDNTITVGTVNVSGVISEISASQDMVTDGGSVSVSNGHIVINNATPNASIDFKLTLTNNSTLNNSYYTVFRSNDPNVVNSFAVTVANTGTAAQDLVFSSLNGKKESNFVVWDNADAATPRVYNFTLTLDSAPVSGTFDIDVISTQKSAVNYVTTVAEIEAAPSGSWVVLANDITATTGLNLTKAINLDLNGKVLTVADFSITNAAASGEYTIKNGKVVTTVGGVNISLPLATINIADDQFIVPQGQQIVIDGSTNTVNFSGVVGFKQTASTGEEDIPVQIPADTRVVIARTVAQALNLNIVGGNVTLENASFATGGHNIEIAHTVDNKVSIKNSGAIATITNNTKDANAGVAIENEAQANLKAVVVSTGVTANVEVVNKGTLETITANSAQSNVVLTNTNTGANVTVDGSNASSVEKETAITTKQELEDALASSKATKLFISNSIAESGNYTITRNVEVIGVAQNVAIGAEKRPTINGTITVTAKNVTLTNLIITGANRELDRVLVTQAADNGTLTIRNCELNNNRVDTATGASSLTPSMGILSQAPGLVLNVEDCQINLKAPRYAMGINYECSGITGVTLNVTNTNIIFEDSHNLVSYTYARGINFGGNAKSQMVLKGSEIIGPYYAINVLGTVANLDCEVVDSTLSGWAAFNIWGTNSTYKITNSTLIGTNNKVKALPPNIDNEDFATIVLNKDAATSADNNEIHLTDSKVISALARTGIEDKESALQHFIIIKSAETKIFIKGNTILENNTAYRLGDRDVAANVSLIIKKGDGATVAWNCTSDTSKWVNCDDLIEAIKNLAQATNP